MGGVTCPPCLSFPSCTQCIPLLARQGQNLWLPMPTVIHGAGTPFVGIAGTTVPSVVSLSIPGPWPVPGKEPQAHAAHAVVLMGTGSRGRGAWLGGITQCCRCRQGVAARRGLVSWSLHTWAAWPGRGGGYEAFDRSTGLHVAVPPRLCIIPLKPSPALACGDHAASPQAPHAASPQAPHPPGGAGGCWGLWGTPAARRLSVPARHQPGTANLPG